MALLAPAARRWVRLTGLAAALALVVPGVLRPLSGHLLDGVNLVFHEAGHVLLAWGGETVMLLGGSVMQVLVPLACAGAFLLRGERFSAGIVTLWAAHSLAGVAAYVRDAPVRTLDLITGDPDTHDWWQLLGACLTPHCGRLDWADPLGRLLTLGAMLLLLGGIVLALWDDWILRPDLTPVP